MTPSRARDLLLFWAGGGEVPREERPAVAEHYLRLEQKVERQEADLAGAERGAAEASGWSG